MTARRATAVLAWSLLALWVFVAALFVWQSQHQPIAGRVGARRLTGRLCRRRCPRASRHPGNAVGWLLAVALLIALGELGETYIHTRSNPGYLAVAWVNGWLFNVWLLLITAFLPLVFPDGRLLSPRWRPVLWLAVATLATQVVTVAVAPGRLAVTAGVDNRSACRGPRCAPFSRCSPSPPGAPSL